MNAIPAIGQRLVAPYGDELIKWSKAMGVDQPPDRCPARLGWAAAPRRECPYSHRPRSRKRPADGRPETDPLWRTRRAAHGHASCADRAAGGDAAVIGTALIAKAESAGQWLPDAADRLPWRAADTHHAEYLHRTDAKACRAIRCRRSRRLPDRHVTRLTIIPRDNCTTTMPSRAQILPAQRTTAPCPKSMTDNWSMHRNNRKSASPPHYLVDEVHFASEH